MKKLLLNLVLFAQMPDRPVLVVGGPENYNHSEALFSPFGKKFFRYRVVRSLVVPARGRYPPACAIPKKLNAVDAAALVGLIVIGEFIGREYVHDIAKSTCDAIDLTLGKPL